MLSVRIIFGGVIVPFTKNELETILYTIEGYIQGNDDDKLCDELCVICDKIVEELDPPKVTITPQELEGDISTVRDSDYADKVDTLVGNMVAHDDNVFTHDSEGC